MTSIFVSSVSELQPAREQIAEDLRAIGFRAIIFEKFPSDPDPPLAACLRKLRKCDAMILIVGPRYGSPIRRCDVSSTHQEFRKARRWRIPIYAFLLPPADAAGPQERQQLAAFEKEVRDAVFCKRSSIDNIRSDIANTPIPQIRGDAPGLRPRTAQPSDRLRPPKPVPSKFWKYLPFAVCILSLLLMLASFSFNGTFAIITTQELGPTQGRPLPAYIGPGVERLCSDPDRAVSARASKVRGALMVGDRTVVDPWVFQKSLYTYLVQVSRKIDALEVMKEVLKYAEAEDIKPGGYSFRYVLERDIALLYEQLDDIPNAKKFHRRTKENAENFLRWRRASECDTASTMAPRYWDTALLAAKTDRRNTGRARGELDQAENMLRECFAKECQSRGLVAPSNATLVQFFDLVVADGIVGFESLASKVREHELTKAWLHYCADDFEQAKRLLAWVEAQTAYPFAEEIRSDVYAPFLRAKLLLPHHEFDAALEAVEEAKRHAGPRHFAGYPVQPAVGSNTWKAIEELLENLKAALSG